MQHHIVDVQSVDVPKGLVGIVDGDIAQFEVVHLSEKLRTVNHAVSHLHIVGVSDGRPGAWREIAVGDKTSVDMPQGIFSLEAAVVTFDIAAFLDARLPLGDGDVLQSESVRLKEWALATERLILDYFLHYFRLFSASIKKCAFYCFLAVP